MRTTMILGTAMVLAVVLTGCVSAGSTSWSTVGPSQSEATSASLRARLAPPSEPSGTAPAVEVVATSARMETSGRETYSPPPPPSPWDAPSTTTSAVVDTAREQLRYAQADARQIEEPNEALRTAHDGTTQQLLIYTAYLGIAAHHVNEKQDRVEEIARQHGGHLSSRTDDTIVVRVPAGTFQTAYAEVQELGDVVTRRVETQDVTEEFHDVQLRIRTLEAMRARVELLLGQAPDVQAALAVEEHLERITLALEQLQGRLRFLSDQVAFSTITVRFAEQVASREPTFQLPFRWLHELGLHTLMAL